MLAKRTKEKIIVVSLPETWSKKHNRKNNNNNIFFNLILIEKLNIQKNQSL